VSDDFPWTLNTFPYMESEKTIDRWLALHDAAIRAEVLRELNEWANSEAGSVDIVLGGAQAVLDRVQTMRRSSEGGTDPSLTACRPVKHRWSTTTYLASGGLRRECGNCGATRHEEAGR
jgi:hypothetical protein